ncbi:hypothetical protein SAMN05192544_107815 [Paraburkholderia hospita]|nr:hypothetical protein [Paraburkholderia hospita]SEI26895.1 hypothetical protein SAMN05192544_107815 [Paraburkholderia hospita]
MMRSGIQYQSNIGGGDFQHAKDCFHAWKQQPLAYRMSQHRFEGKREVRLLAGDSVFEDAEVAQRTLAKTCGPNENYALAAQIYNSERDMWLVMAAYEE